MTIVYLVRRFPVLSQTFVRDEIADHLRAGLDVRVVALEGSPADPVEAPFAGRVYRLGIQGSMWRLLGRIARVALPRPSRLAILARAARRVRRSRWREAIRATVLAVALEEQLAGADVLHAHFGHIGDLAALALAVSGNAVPLIATIHGHDIARLGGPTGIRIGLGSLLVRADRMLCVNTIWRDRLLAAGAEDARVLVQHLGVDTALLDASSRRVTADDAVLRIVMTARMDEVKGHIYALRAISRLGTAYPDLRLHLDLIGGGPLTEQVWAMVDVLGVDDRVTLHGALPHAAVLELLRTADLFLLPSATAANGDMEGIPVALMEAMSLRLPVISTRLSGIPELVEDGVSGLLCDERDDAALAAAVALLATSAQRRQAMGEAGRRRVLAEFDQARQCASLRAIYRDVVATRKDGHG